MEPLRGTVIASRGTELCISLKFGTRVSIPKRKDLKIGDACYICYDYTRMRVVAIWTTEQMMDDGQRELPKLQKEEIICRVWDD